MITQDEVRESYDTLAAEYALRLCHELEGKPYDLHLLRRFAEAVAPGPVCDLGCGPGHVTSHLVSLGLDARGVDLSPAMIAEARRRHPSLDFQVGDMLDLELPTESFGGVVALYSIIHFERRILPQALREMHRVLRPGGQVLTSFHKGQGELHEDHVLDTHVSLDCTLFEPEEVARAMEEAGLSVAEITVRRPYDAEYPTQRAYILADK